MTTFEKIVAEMTIADWITFIGIGLTFLISVISVIISIVSIRTTKNTADHTNYINTIVVEREKWSFLFREKCAEYLSAASGIRNYYLPDFNNEQDQIYYSITSLRHEIALLLNSDESNTLEKLQLEFENDAIELYQIMKDGYSIKLNSTQNGQDYNTDEEYKSIKEKEEKYKDQLNTKKIEIKKVMRKILKDEWEVRKIAVTQKRLGVIK